MQWITIIRLVEYADCCANIATLDWVNLAIPKNGLSSQLSICANLLDNPNLQGMKMRIDDPSGFEKLASFFTDNGHKILGWASIMIAPIKVLLLNIYVLVAIDLFTGIWASVKNGDSIISSKMSRTITKMISYGISLYVASKLDSFLPELSTMKIASAYISLTEAKSIFENLSVITKADIWTLLLDRLKTAKLLKPKQRKKKRGSGSSGRAGGR